MNSILCLYHAPCNDGSAAAAALAWRLHRANWRDGEFEVLFCPMSYLTEWDEELSAEYLDAYVSPRWEVSDIFIVDFSISVQKHAGLIRHLESNGRIGTDAPRTVCIDHHRTALEKLDELESYCDETFIHIGPGLSGATLVWKYFNERSDDALPVPLLLRYVADQDIWEWKLEDSRAVNAALNTLDGMADAMVAELRESLSNPEAWLERRRGQGEAIISMVDAQVVKSARQALHLHVRELDLFVVNSTSYNSELGNHICLSAERTPDVLALIYTVQNDWSIRCSVRSIDGAGINARMFAERFGGGGHDNAAGCRFRSVEEFRAVIERIHTDGWTDGVSEQ